LLDANTPASPISTDTGAPAGDNRVDFSLASAPIAPFTRAVYALQTPGVSGAIGFAAVPDSSEGCPSTTPGNDGYVAIPQGYEWRKLWQFRASLPERAYFYVQSLRDMGVACDPGKFNNPSFVTTNGLHPNDYFLYPDCGVYNSQTKFGIGMSCPGTTPSGEPYDSLTSEERLSRILFPITSQDMQNYHRCITIPKSVNSDDQAIRPRCANSSYSCSSGNTDVFGICVQNSSLLKDRYTGSSEVSTMTSQASPDFIFIVTPVDVTAAHLTREMSSNQHKNYLPQRPAPGDGATPINYHVVTDGKQFPLCVLQKQGGN